MALPNNRTIFDMGRGQEQTRIVCVYDRLVIGDQPAPMAAIAQSIDAILAGRLAGGLEASHARIHREYWGCDPGMGQLADVHRLTAKSAQGLTAHEQWYLASLASRWRLAGEGQGGCDSPDGESLTGRRDAEVVPGGVLWDARRPDPPPEIDYATELAEDATFTEALAALAAAKARRVG